MYPRPMWRGRASLAVLTMTSSLVLACGDDEGMAADAAMDDASVDSGLAVTPPALPALPTMTPCPSGWAEVADGELVVCDPYPATKGPMTCGVDEAHFPGEPGCARVGSACPPGDFADDLPSDRPVLYVRAGASGGDGTIASPFGRVLDAMRRATTGTVIAIGKGTYDELIQIGPGVTLWGACVAETILTSSVASENDPVIEPIGADTAVRNLRIGRPARVGIVLDSTIATLSLEAVIIEGAVASGIVMYRGALDAHDLVIRDTRAVTGITSAALGGDGDFRATIERAVLERSPSYGVVVTGPSARLELRGVVVSETRRAAAGEGRSVSILGGAQASIARSALVDAAETSLVVIDPASSLALEDTVIRNRTTPEASNAHGLAVEAGAAVTVSRVLIEDAVASGLWVRATGSHVTTNDLVVRETHPTAAGTETGRGIQILFGASATMTRTAITRVSDIAIIVAPETTTATLEDLVVTEVAERTFDSQFGRCVSVQAAGTIEVRRARCEGFADIGVFVSRPGSSALLEDVTIRDGRGVAANGLYGRGVVVQAGGRATLDRGVIERVREVGAVAADSGSTVELRDTAVRDVLPSRCFEDGRCPGSPGGLGIGAFLSGSTTATRFEVRRANLCGVQVARDGALSLDTGTIAECPIAACINVPGFDVSRLDNGVVYADNGARLDTTELPVPDPVASAGE